MAVWIILKQPSWPMPLTAATLVTLLKDRPPECVRLMEPGQDQHLLAELVIELTVLYTI